MVDLMDVVLLFVGLVIIALLLVLLSRQMPKLDLKGVEPRTILAFGIVAISVLGVILLAIIVILAAADRGDASDKVMTAVLPLLGTWVGTVMAFYFGRENFESGAQNTRATFKEARTADEILQSTPAADKMLKWSDAIFFEKLADKPLADAQKDVNLVALLNELDQRGAAVGKKWNRIPILTFQSFPLYVIHRSLITEFIAKQSAGGRSTEQIQGQTLQDMFSDPQFQMTLIQSISVLSEKSTLADAKEAMSKTPNCQDVFITRDGTRNEEILGWLTNIDIEQAGRV